jgi:hypothetical protein
MSIDQGAEASPPTDPSAEADSRPPDGSPPDGSPPDGSRPPDLEAATGAQPGQISRFHQTVFAVAVVALFVVPVIAMLAVLSSTHSIDTLFSDIGTEIGRQLSNIGNRL